MSEGKKRIIKTANWCSELTQRLRIFTDEYKKVLKKVPFSAIFYRCLERGQVLKSSLLDESLVFQMRKFATLGEK